MQTTNSVNKSDYEGQGHFLTLVQGYLHIKIETCFSQKPLGRFPPIFYALFLVQGNEN